MTPILALTRLKQWVCCRLLLPAAHHFYTTTPFLPLPAPFHARFAALFCVRFFTSAKRSMIRTVDMAGNMFFTPADRLHVTGGDVHYV